MQEKQSEEELFDPRENLNRPHWKRFKLQGKDRFLAIIHKQTEQKTTSGIVIANVDSFQDIPSTATVIAISALSDEAKENYPDVKVGANIQVIPCTWTEFDVLGERVATGTFEYIIATYNWKGNKTLEEQEYEQAVAHREALVKYRTETTEAILKTETVSSGFGIVIK